MSRDRGAASLSRVARMVANGLDRDRPQRGGVGVEAEHYLTAPILDQRSEPVSEGEDAFDSTAEGLPDSLEWFFRG